MASKVPSYMKATAAAKGRRAALGGVSSNVRPKSAGKPSATEGQAAPRAEPAKDILRAKELVLDAKAAETTGKLREALNLYRQALKLVPASHVHKLRAKLNSVREALRLQKAAADAVAGAKTAKKEDAAPVARKPVPRRLAGVRARVPSRFAPKTARPASARTARPTSASTAPRACPAGARPSTAATKRPAAKPAGRTKPVAAPAPATPPRTAATVDDGAPVPSPAPPAPEPAPVVGSAASAPEVGPLSQDDATAEPAAAADIGAMEAEEQVARDDAVEPAAANADDEAAAPVSHEDASEPSGAAPEATEKAATVPETAVEAVDAAPASPAAASSPAAAASPAPRRSMTVPSTGDVIQDSLLAILNTADEAGLMDLPTIGRKRASVIVSTREEGGPFPSVADLSRIGISDKQAAKLLAAYSKAVASGKLALAAARARKSL